jgi:fatty acid desaturase/membrane-associated phospholipid phosphatase
MLTKRVRAHLGLKVWLVAGLGLLITVPYFATARSMAPLAHAVPATWVDGAVAYSEPWAWAYVSLYVFLLVPLLSDDRTAIRRYGTAMAIVCIVSHAAFVLFPTTASVVAQDPSTWLLGVVVWADGSANACPSLHASLAVLTATAATALFGRRRWVVAVAYVWASTIVFAALATKRHVAIDVAAGALLALGAWSLARALRHRGARDPAPRCADAAPLATVHRTRTTEEARALVGRGLERELAELRALDWRKRAAELTVFAGLWGAGAALALASLLRAPAPAAWLGAAAGVLLCAVGINAFVLLLHEGMHSTLFDRPWLNHAVSVLCGGLVLMSFSAYRVMHTRHHLYLGDPRDPDDYHNYTGRRCLVWCLHYMRLVVGTFLYIVLIPVFALRFGSRTNRIAIALEYLLLMPAWIVFATIVPGPVLLAVWGLPVLLVAYFTSIRGFTQHGITVADDPFLASRSIRPSRLVAFCLLNENFHLEHHLFPEIPSYNLARLNALVDDRIPYRVTGASYLEFIGRFLSATPRMREEPIGLTRQEAE